MICVHSKRVINSLSRAKLAGVKKTKRAHLVERSVLFIIVGATVKHGAG